MDWQNHYIRAKFPCVMGIIYADMLCASSIISVSHSSLSNRGNYRLIASAITEIYQACDLDSVHR